MMMKTDRYPLPLRRASTVYREFIDFLLTHCLGCFKYFVVLRSIVEPITFHNKTDVKFDLFSISVDDCMHYTTQHTYTFTRYSRGAKSNNISCQDRIAHRQIEM